MIEGSSIEPHGTTRGQKATIETGLDALPRPESRQLRIVDGVKGWRAEAMDVLRPEVISGFEGYDICGPDLRPVEPLFGGEIPEAWPLIQHGFAKGTAMILGLGHHHDGDDLIVTSGWPAVLEGFGYSFDGDKPLRIVDAAARFTSRIEELRTLTSS